jgi:ABC-2 type transport system permease protein
MSGIAIHERSGDGRQVQNIVFPYILVKYKDRSIPVTLLVNQPGHSGEDNLNLSGELLEYRLAHAIRLLSQDESKRIVFLEGHGEWPEEAISEITDRLSYEYTIDRGALSGRPAELNEYDAVIIAGPQSPFSETDKWAVDQYLMQGGSLLWLINGVQIRSYDELAQSGETLSRANDLNLNDLFFTYGFRINPVILQDRQCLTLPIAQTNASGVTDYVPAPWYFAPVLMPDNQSEVTKGLSPVKTEWASTVSLVGENTNLRREVLLASSPEAHLLPAPASIRLDETVQTTGENYFNASNLPVAVLLQGVFPSVFQNRPAFPATSDQPFLSESQPARMIVIASDELIIDPLGYDRYSQTWFANGEFIVNAVDFLTDNTGLPALKNKSLHRQSLNRQALQRDRQRIVFFNLVLPPALLLLVFLTLSFIRKRKYGLKRK